MSISLNPHPFGIQPFQIATSIDGVTSLLVPAGDVSIVPSCTNSRRDSLILDGSPLGAVLDKAATATCAALASKV